MWFKITWKQSFATFSRSKPQYEKESFAHIRREKYKTFSKVGKLLLLFTALNGLAIRLVSGPSFSVTLRPEPLFRSNRH